MIHSTLFDDTFKSGRGTVAQGKWRKLDGANRMPEIIQRIAFGDGIKQLQSAA